MKADELQQALAAIEVPAGLEARLIRNRYRKATGRFNYRKPVGIAVVFILAVALLVGTPYLLTDPTTGLMELVMIDNPLVIRVAAASENEELVIQNFASGTEIPLGGYSIAMSSVPGFPFLFSYPGTSIQLSVDNGQFLLWNIDITVEEDYLVTRGRGSGSSGITHVGPSYSIDDEGFIFWVPYTEDFDGYLPTEALIEYRLYDDKHIVGYGIIEIDSENYWFTAKLLRSVEFPQVNGKYQPVTLDHLEELKQQILQQAE